MTEAEHDNDGTLGVDLEIPGVNDSDDNKETSGVDETESQESKSDEGDGNEQK